MSGQIYFSINEFAGGPETYADPNSPAATQAIYTMQDAWDIE
jgi:hypothetical protein